MEKTINENQVEYTDATLEILDLTNDLKQKVKNGMMIGERHILRGIVIFEEVIKKLNINNIDDEAINMIMSCVHIVLYKEEERLQHVNNNVHYGINLCFNLVNIYNKTQKNNLRKMVYSK